MLYLKLNWVLTKVLNWDTEKLWKKENYSKQDIKKRRRKIEKNLIEHLRKDTSSLYKCNENNVLKAEPH